MVYIGTGADMYRSEARRDYYKALREARRCAEIRPEGVPGPVEIVADGPLEKRLRPALPSKGVSGLGRELERWYLLLGPMQVGGRLGVKAREVSKRLFLRRGHMHGAHHVGGELLGKSLVVGSAIFLLVDPDRIAST